MGTVKKEILSGRGLHSGIAGSVELRLSDNSSSFQASPAASHGKAPCHPLFHFEAGRTLSPADLGLMRRRAQRGTVLGEGVSEWRTPEHFLATMLFASSLPCDVFCHGVELPGLDGSALPFREAIARLDPKIARQPAWSEYHSGLEWEHEWEYGFIRVRPAPRFEVLYRVERHGLRQAFHLRDADTAWREILPARTWVFHEEWKAAKSQGLMSGAGIESGLLLAESKELHPKILLDNPELPGGKYPLLNQPDWRMPEEAAKHKILDLLGDLALLGLALPSLEIEILNGGHAEHHLLLDRLNPARA